MSQTQTIDLSNSDIADIQTDTFYYFPKLKIFKIRPKNWPTFLDVNWNVAWMAGLNFNITRNLSSANPFTTPNRFDLYLGASNDSYDYPEQDFCYFADFPHYRNILAIVNFEHKGECTCTLMSIIRYSWRFPHSSSQATDYHMSTGYKYCLNNNYNQTIENCKLDEKIKLCESRSTRRPISTTTTSLKNNSSSYKINLIHFSFLFIYFLVSYI